MRSRPATMMDPSGMGPDLRGGSVDVLLSGLVRRSPWPLRCFVLVLLGGTVFWATRKLHCVWIVRVRVSGTLVAERTGMPIRGAIVLVGVDAKAIEDEGWRLREQAGHDWDPHYTDLNSSGGCVSAETGDATLSTTSVSPNS